MKKCIVTLGLLVLFLALLLPLSCSMGMDPAKSGTTTVSLSIPSMVPPANAVAKLNPVPGRAVAPGEGYLYIRTVGGPTGSKGPFYGPFPLASGSTFTTTEIPAGTYSHVGILYATEPLEGLSGWWNEREMTFTELMSLNDQDFLEFSDGEEENSLFDEMIAGYASGEMIENVVIRANQANTIRARLVPFGVQVDSFINLQAGIYDENPPPGRIRRYFEVTGVYQPDGTRLSSVTWDSLSSTIHRAMLFDESGILLGELRDGESTAINYTGGDHFYVYLDYEGYLVSSMTASLSPASPYTKILYISEPSFPGPGDSPSAPASFSSTFGLNQNTVICVVGAMNMDNRSATFTTKNHLLTSFTKEPQIIAMEFGGSFTVTSGTELTLRNITLSCNGNPNSLPLVSVQGGTLRLERGATLKDRTNSGNSGGGVIVGDSGRLFMEEGSVIRNCHSNDNYAPTRGGAVFVSSASSGTTQFVMNGGTIEDCSAKYGGAVAVFAREDSNATFTMTGGLVQNCRAASGSTSGSGQGGGVYVFADNTGTANFIMSGGIISKCIAEMENTGAPGNGGGVYVNGGGSVSFSGQSSISECEADNGWGLCYNNPDKVSPNPETQINNLKTFFNGNKDTAIFKNPF